MKSSKYEKELLKKKGKCFETETNFETKSSKINNFYQVSKKNFTQTEPSNYLKINKDQFYYFNS